jgi:mRNA-decapping enzyme 1B
MPPKMSDDARRKANLRVLQRADATVQDILDSATHVGLYEFDQVNGAWEKKTVEGSLFFVKCQNTANRLQVVILNRSAADNWTLAIAPKMQLQNADPYLILRYKDETGASIISGIWFHNGQERDTIAAVLQRAIASLDAAAPAVVDVGAAASALLSPLTLGDHTIPVSRAPAAAAHSQSPIPHQRRRSAEATPTPSESGSQNQQHLVLDKKSLQLSLLSLIQDDRFLDLIHAQYLKVAHRRANRGEDGE